MSKLKRSALVNFLRIVEHGDLFIYFYRFLNSGVLLVLEASIKPEFGFHFSAALCVCTVSGLERSGVSGDWLARTDRTKVVIF